MVRPPVIAALLVALTLALGACGGSGGSAASQVGGGSGGPSGMAQPRAVGALPDARAGGRGRTPSRASEARAAPDLATARGYRVPDVLAGRTFIAAEVDGRLLTYGTVLELRFGTRTAVAFTGPEHDRVCGFAGIFRVAIVGRQLRFARPPSAGSSEAPGMVCDTTTSDQKRWFATWLPSRPQFTLHGRQLTLSDDDVRIRFTERR